MKRICKTFVVLLVVITSLLSFSITVGATETSNTHDGLVASIISDKDSYQANEDIELTFKVTNTNDFAVESISLEAIIPDGLKLKNQTDTKKDIISLGADESLEFSVTVIKEKNTSTTSSIEDTSTVTTEPMSSSNAEVIEPTATVSEETQPVSTEATETPKVETTTATITETNSVQATTAKSNQSVVSNNNSDNTTIKTGNNISCLILALVCLVCLAVAILAFRFRKQSVKYLSLVLCVCISISSIAVIGVTNTFAKENTELSLFEVSKNIKIDSEEFEIKSIISYIYTLDNSIYEEKQVTETIDNLSDSDEFKNLSDNEKVAKYKELLNECADKGLVKKDSIDYDNGIVGFECKNGAQYLLEVATHSHKELEDFDLSPNVNQTRNLLKTSSVSNSKSISAVVMYDWFKYGENPNFDDTYYLRKKELENFGINTSLLLNPTVENYKTAFLDKDIIEISVHGTRYKNATYLHLTETINNFNDQTKYADDIAQKRIVKLKTLEDGKYYYNISSKFFKHYYKKSNLKNSIVFLESCYGFGENNKNNFNYADTFIDVGAETVIGYNHYTTITYVMSITSATIAELTKGNTVNASIEKAKSIYGSNNSIYLAKAGLSPEDISVSPIIRGKAENRLFDNSISSEITGIVYEDDNKTPISDVIIEVYNSNNTKVTETITGLYGLIDEGHFIINALPQGNYKFVFSKNGYSNKTLDVQLIKGIDKGIIINLEKEHGSLSGGVVSGLDNTPIPDVKVSAYLKLKSGNKLVETVYTDSLGNFSMELQGGNYEVTLEKDGYKSVTITPTISNNQMFILKDPIVMKKEENYRDDFINALLENEDQWHDFNGYAGEFVYFCDLNFDDCFELITTHPGGTMRNDYFNIYYLKNNQVTLANFNQKSTLIQGVPMGVINGYYDSKTKNYYVFESQYWQENSSAMNFWKGNCELQFDGEKVVVNYHSSMWHNYDYTTQYESYRYYDGANGYADTTGITEISEVEYNKINEEKLKNLVDINMKRELILCSDWENYSDSEKREALERSYDSFTYDKY